MKTSKSFKPPKQGAKEFHVPINDESGRYVDRDLVAVNPLKQQFEPTDAEPVRQQYKMAGGC